MKIIHTNCALRNDHESDVRSKNTTWAVVKFRCLEKNQAWTGFEPMTSVMPVQRSANWANKLAFIFIYLL